MYAIPALVAVAILAALVYLPKIRKPVLWLALSLFGLAAIGTGVWYGVARHNRRIQAAEDEREASLLVDHVIGRPAHCKLSPFGTVEAKPAGWKKPINGKRRTAEMLSDAELLELLRGTDTHRAPSSAEDAECREEVEALRSLIKRRAHALNAFIKTHQEDSRVASVQVVLAANGEAFEETCSDLKEQRKDDYDLHVHGCKP